jgi:hypothetical protein
MSCTGVLKMSTPETPDSRGPIWYTRTGLISFTVAGLIGALACAACDHKQQGAPDGQQERTDTLIEDLQAKPRWVASKVVDGWEDESFDRREHAAKVLGDMGAAGIPAIPALMNVLGDHRNSSVAGYYTTSNSRSVPTVAYYAAESLRKLIPISNGFWFDEVVKRLLAPEEDKEPYRQNSLLAAAGTGMGKRVGMVGILSSYGDRAVPVLLKTAYLYGDTHDGGEFGDGGEEGLEENSVRGLGDFGKRAIGTLCDISLKHPSWSVRRVAAITVLGIADESWDEEDSLQPLAQRACAASAATASRPR